MARSLQPASPSRATARQKARAGEREGQAAKASVPGRVLARAGLFSRGVVYVVLGYLTADIAAGKGGGKNASGPGALVVIAHQPAGPALLCCLAAGFLAYAAWWLLQAAAGDASEEGGADALKRLGWSGIAVVYVALAVRALLILATSGQSHGSNSAFSASRTLLQAGGPALLGLVGVGVTVGGLSLSAWATRHDFTTRLDRARMPRALLVPSRAVEVFGNVVRGLAFAAIGVSMLAAAVSGSAREAKGLNGVLRSLAAQPFGPELLGLAVAGFVAFGLASFVEAAYRNVASSSG